MAQTILQRIAAGDPTGVRACLDEYGNTIWSIAQRYLGPMGEDVEDAVQEIFVEVWKSGPGLIRREGLSQASSPPLRRLINRQRKASRGRAVALEHVAEPAQKAAVHEPAALRDEARAAAAAFEQLSEDEKQLLHLSIHQGLSHERIAKATDLPLGTVKTRIRRGLIRLREMIGESPTSGHAAVATGGAS